MSQSCTVFLISGPPASGKSTLCGALAAQFERAVHIPVDDVRTWVVSGLSESVPWTEETEAQFQIAEAAVAEAARCYVNAGFEVFVDHCRNPARLEALVQERLMGVRVVKVCLVPELGENLNRSHTRTNKKFHSAWLDDTIAYTNVNYRKAPPEGWQMIDNTSLTVEETVDTILAIAEAMA